MMVSSPFRRRKLVRFWTSYSISATSSRNSGNTEPSAVTSLRMMMRRAVSGVWAWDSRRTVKTRLPSSMVPTLASSDAPRMALTTSATPSR